MHGVLRLSRDELARALTVPDDGSGVSPSPITWDGVHPFTGLADGGLALSRPALSTSSADALRVHLVAAGLTGHLGNRVTVTPGPVVLRAELTTPGGSVPL